MKKFLIIAFLSLAGPTCFAQGTSTTTPYKTELQKLLTLSGSEASFKVAIDQMIGTLKQQQSDIPAEFWTEMETELKKTSMTELLDLLLPVYQKHLSIDDLKQITAFYESPAGKKFAEKTPLILNGSMEAGKEWGMKIGQRVVDKIKEKYN
ncbi:DUF2059 domain-containing protein [Pedobacter sp. ASV12]|uniref:DUF2059 domain-containing protein n=1 Tax=Pedobacter sp. ASV12 TaxID=2795120 RepID=UPI0018EB74D7|nr:DUF2059 domain-containing protein [Pedobacter sp. ASV12]